MNSDNDHEMVEEEQYELPSYHDAKQVDPWPHVLPYLQRKDLLSLCRVSRRLKGRVQGHLWRNPRKYFPGDEVDDLNAFVHLIGTITLLEGTEPASYIRTIDISNLGNDNFYIDIPENWLAVLVSQLSKLRSLRLANSPLLDSRAMNCLHNVQYRNIRFIDVSYCHNATSERLSLMVALLPQLCFLDLSGHRGLRSTGMLNRIRKLNCLQVLRLRKCNLDDSDISELFGESTNSSTRSVINIRSLDLSSNNLTDDCIYLISTLTKASMLGENIMPPSYNQILDPASRASELEDPIYSMLEEKLKRMSMVERNQPLFQDDTAKIISNLENPNLPDPAAQKSGLTHLYISGNEITFEGLRELLTLHRLEALDCGSIKLGNDESLICREEDDIIKLQLLHNELNKYNRLQYLRISHRVVTSFQTNKQVSNSEEITRHEFGSRDDSPFPLGLYCIDKLVLTQIPETPTNNRTYSRLQQFKASYNDIQKKLFVHQNQLSHSFNKFPVRRLFGRHSLLTKELLFETFKEQRLSNKDDLLDIYASDNSYDDFTFFASEKTSRNSMEKTYHYSSKNNEGDGLGDSKIRQLTVADLARSINKGSNIRGHNTRQHPSIDDVVWQGKVKLVDGGLD